MGYNIGRWIYIIDAFDDLKKDFKKKKYNPFLNRINDIDNDLPILAKELEITLTYTLSNIAAAYDILTVRQNDAIIRNVLYSGLVGVQTQILKNGFVKLK